jgi:outer membrane biosynthesis protein TonB
MEQDDSRNRRIGILTSVGIHAGIFLALFFLVAWRAPNPPNPEYGIELNFGLDSEGSGDIQPQENVGSDTEDPAKEPVQEDTAPSEESKPENNEIVPEKTVDPTPTQEENPVSIKEEKKVVKNNSKVTKKTDVKPKDEKVVVEYKNDNKTTETTENSRKGKEGSQGDDTNKTGDKGNPQGTLNADALYGTPGGGGGGDGFGLNMSGWTWADAPRKPELPDNESGRVIFEIECDENGDIVAITPVERGLSLKAEQILKEEIRRNSLIRTSGGKVPQRSKGRIIFTLKAK